VPATAPSPPAASTAASGAGLHAPSRAAGQLGLRVIERGWLSANQAVFAPAGTVPATVVDTGFCGHAPQTVALVDQALGGAPLGRILNTHLHSDHCGGNRALQDRGGVETWVPLASVEIVRRWDEDALSYRLTDQPCPRFAVDRALVPGEEVAIGPAQWQVHAAPGHDMDAILLFEPQTRTLIAGDALWESRLAIIFPELVDEDGFGPTRRTLDLIERLQPREVVPGHGRPFEDVAAALAASRERVAAFERQPERHREHAARALLMFHLLEVREAAVAALVDWMTATPIYRQVARRAGLDEARSATWAQAHVDRLVDDGALERRGDRVAVRPQAD
jgi:glyoxylase-like metal-dependent hydrolase (beta-lactamase superfamily II)